MEEPQQQQSSLRKERVPDTKKMIEMLEESRAMGSDTATKMSEQTEQLRRMQSSTDNINGELDQSRYLLKKLGLRRKFNKAFKMFNQTGPPSAPKEEIKYNKIQMMKEKLYGVHSTDNAEEITEHKTVNPSVAEIRLRTKNRAERLNSQGNNTESQLASSGENIVYDPNSPNSPNTYDNTNPFSSSTSTGSYYDLDPTSPEAQEIREQDEDLDRMSEILTNLKEISLAQKREADLQGQQLDTLTGDVEKVRIKQAAGSRALTMKYGSIKSKAKTTL
eukprot:TRINITY_DN2951_c0_g1_i5.p1 TRINITY_DN2951_c0_g1~~TRINITY_DN2951_c0_g1_i5.p1  ORF type:complete len:276 (-),score=61.21 TRINITY_DN2951_c0_g1_i5:219-1046(-)